MINRRSFFGFACGGAAAAPLALIGDKASGAPRKGTEVAQLSVKVDVDADGKLRAYVQEAVNKGIRSYDEQQRRSGFVDSYRRLKG